MMNTRRSQNQPPAGLSLPDRITWPYDRYFADTDENEIDASFGVSDPDMHALQYRWTLGGWNRRQHYSRGGRRG